MVNPYPGVKQTPLFLGSSHYCRVAGRSWFDFPAASLHPVSRPPLEFDWRVFFSSNPFSSHSPAPHPVHPKVLEVLDAGHECDGSPAADVRTVPIFPCWPPRTRGVAVAR